MIYKKDILPILKMLDKQYNSALNSTLCLEPIYYSKLAVIEYCGWLEEALDSIIRRSVKNKVRTTDFQNMLDDGIIGTTYGFQYKKHFRKMLLKAKGIEITEKIEQDLKNNGNLVVLCAQLDSMKTHRDKAAHTSTAIVASYPAPSQIINNFNTTFPILKYLYTLACQYN